MKPDEIIKKLKDAYPESKYYLNFSTPIELVVASILSAQCRDEIVNATTNILFKKYKTAKDWEKLNENEIKSITFYKAKAENIRRTMKIIDEKYGGKVPQKADELIKLPGIGKKTANAILQNAFDIVEGIVVDTHVIRVSYRLGLTKERNPEKIEKDLMKIIPKKYWKELPHLFKSHGRNVCKASIPECKKCILSSICPKIGVEK